MIAKGLSDTTMIKLRKKKEADRFGDKDWAAWLTWLVRDVRVEDTFREQIQKATAKSLLSTWMENFAENLPEMNKPRSKTIADLVPKRENLNEPEGSAIVIGRGPSVFKRGYLKMLAESDYRGTIINTDGILTEALRAGVTPGKYRNFLVVTVDGNRTKIVRWFGDPNFGSNNPNATEKEKEENAKNIELVDKHGKGIKAVLSTNVAHNVYERCRKAGIEVYWFHPMFDDYRSNESFSKLMTLMTTTEEHKHGCPKVSCGGNTGATSWVISHALLRHSPICLIGLDMGYPEGTPLDQTNYFSGFMEATKGDMRAVQSAYREVVNPSGEKATADPVYWHYREAFLEMTRDVNPKFETWNCTGGGTLFSNDGTIKWKTFKEFLEAHKE